MVEKHLADGKLYRIADVKPFPENYRRHPTRQVNLIRQGLREFKQYRNLIVWRHPETGVFHSLVGHAVIEAALQEGWTEIFAREYVGLSLAEARTLVAYDNQSALLAEDDQDDLSQLIAAVHAEDESLAALAAGGEDELRRLLEMAGQEPMGAPEAQVNRADELQEIWQVKPGDIFEAADQRLICGDCTDRATVERLMRGEKAGALITDPPWNVGWDYGGYKDNLTVEEYREFSAKWYAIVAPFLEDAWCFVAQSMRNYKHLGSWFPQAERLFAECQNFVQHTPEGMQYACNPFLIWRVGNPQIMPRAGRRDWFLAETSNTRPSGDKSLAKLNSATRWPPTIEYLIDNWGRDNILDPFLGSGTTLVACARLGRRGRGIEIYAPYVSVALQRLQDMGLEVKRVE